MTYHSHLYYGGPGAGKTWELITAFWDPDTGKQIRDGRLLLFGREDNPLIATLPEKLVKRFVSPAEKPLQFMEDFTLYMKAAVAQARKGSGPEVYGVDGFSEWNFIYLLEHTAAYGNGDRWAGWRAAKDSFLGAVQMLNPNELRAHVLATARVAAKKKDTTDRSGAVLVEGDPDWVDSKYFPSMDGWMRDHISYYFNLVSYVDADFGPVKMPDGTVKDEQVSKYWMRNTPQFLVKNTWRREWTLAQMPDYLTNPRFDDIVKAIEDAKAKAAMVLASRPGAATSPQTMGEKEIAKEKV